MPMVLPLGVAAVPTFLTTAFHSTFAPTLTCAGVTDITFTSGVPAAVAIASTVGSDTSGVATSGDAGSGVGAAATGSLFAGAGAVPVVGALQAEAASASPTRRPARRLPVRRRALWSLTDTSEVLIVRVLSRPTTARGCFLEPESTERANGWSDCDLGHCERPSGAESPGTDESRGARTSVTPAARVRHARAHGRAGPGPPP